MSKLTLGLYQARPAFHSIDDALALLDQWLANAASQGVDMLVSPELFLCGYGSAKAVRASAQEQGSPCLNSVGKLVAHYGIGLVLGYPEKSGADFYNSAAVFDRRGMMISNYRKIALPNAFERSCFTAGSEAVLFDFDGIRCSVLICYDIEFPELVRRSARLGAELLLVPTALREKWRFVSDTIVAARAYENAMFIGYCDFSSEAFELQFSGASSICAPDGTQICQASGSEGLIIGQIDTRAVRDRKSDFDFLNDLDRLSIQNTLFAQIA